MRVPRARRGGRSPRSTAGGEEDLAHRYCTECVVTGERVDRRHLREQLSTLGSSLVVAGLHNKVRVHIHVNDPAEVFRVAARFGAVSGEKADDMQRQQHSAHADGSPRRDRHRLGGRHPRSTSSTGSTSTWCRCACTSATAATSTRSGITRRGVLRRDRAQPGAPEDLAAAARRFPPAVRVPRLALRRRWCRSTCRARSAAPAPRRETAAARVSHPRQGHRDRQPERLARPGPRRDVRRRVRAGRLRRRRASSRRRARSCRRTHTFGLVGSLEYAVRGGRVPRWVKNVADALRLMPILHNDREGPRHRGRRAVRPRATCRRSSRASCAVACATTCPTACWWATPTARPTASGCSSNCSADNVVYARLLPLGSALGAHGGPGMLVVGLAGIRGADDHEARDPGHPRRPRARSRHRRGARADPPLDDVRARRGRQLPARLLLLAQRQPEPQRRSSRPSRRWRAAARRSRSPRARRRRSPCSRSPRPAAASSAAPTATTAPPSSCARSCRAGACDVEFVDTTDLDAVRRALEPGATLLWVETPSNPLLRVSDLAALAELAHAHGALLGCDNTFASPVLQQPLALGADLVMHSTTKYLGGHSDVLGGIVVARERARAGSSRCATSRRTGGGVPSPFDCWLLLRSLPTLPLRVRAAVGERAGGGALPALRTRASSACTTRASSDHPGHALARAADARRLRRAWCRSRCRAARARRSPSRRACSCSPAPPASAASRA